MAQPNTTGFSSYLGVGPPVGDGGLDPVIYHQSLHVLQTWFWWYHTLERDLVALCCHWSTCGTLHVHDVAVTDTILLPYTNTEGSPTYRDIVYAWHTYSYERYFLNPFLVQDNQKAQDRTKLLSGLRTQGSTNVCECCLSVSSYSAPNLQILCILKLDLRQKEVGLCPSVLRIMQSTMCLTRQADFR